MVEETRTRVEPRGAPQPRRPLRCRGAEKPTPRRTQQKPSPRRAADRRRSSPPGAVPLSDLAPTAGIGPDLDIIERATPRLVAHRVRAGQSRCRRQRRRPSEGRIAPESTVSRFVRAGVDRSYALGGPGREGSVVLDGRLERALVPVHRPAVPASARSEPRRIVLADAVGAECFEPTSRNATEHTVRFRSTSARFERPLSASDGSAWTSHDPR